MFYERPLAQRPHIFSEDTIRRQRVMLAFCQELDMTPEQVEAQLEIERRHRLKNHRPAEIIVSRR